MAILQELEAPWNLDEGLLELDRFDPPISRDECADVCEAYRIHPEAVPLIYAAYVRGTEPLDDVVESVAAVIFPLPEGFDSTTPHRHVTSEQVAKGYQRAVAKNRARAFFAWLDWVYFQRLIGPYEGW